MESIDIAFNHWWNEAQPLRPILQVRQLSARQLRVITNQIKHAFAHGYARGEHPHPRSHETPAVTKKLSLRCYCCGESLEDDVLVALVSLSEETDRVFVMDLSHVGRVQDGFHEPIIRGKPLASLKQSSP